MTKTKDFIHNTIIKDEDSSYDDFVFQMFEQKRMRVKRLFSSCILNGEVVNIPSIGEFTKKDNYGSKKLRELFIKMIDYFAQNFYNRPKLFLRDAYEIIDHVFDEDALEPLVTFTPEQMQKLMPHLDEVAYQEAYEFIEDEDHSEEDRVLIAFRGTLKMRLQSEGSDVEDLYIPLLMLNYLKNNDCKDILLQTNIIEDLTYWAEQMERNIFIKHKHGSCCGYVEDRLSFVSQMDTFVKTLREGIPLEELEKDSYYSF